MARRQLATWLPPRGVAFWSVVLLALVLAPTQRALLVAGHGCRRTVRPLLGPQVTCPVYAESYHGGVWPVWVSVSSHPTSTTSHLAGLRRVGAVTPGMHWAGLVGDVVVAVAVAAVLTVVFALVIRRGMRTPPYGSVRRRHRMRI